MWSFLNIDLLSMIYFDISDHRSDPENIYIIQTHDITDKLNNFMLFPQSSKHLQNIFGRNTPGLWFLQLSVEKKLHHGSG